MCVCVCVCVCVCARKDTTNACLYVQVTAKKLFRRLESLGAQPLMPIGLGNDQHPAGYEAALDPWALSLWPLARQVPPETVWLCGCVIVCCDCATEFDCVTVFDCVTEFDCATV